MYIIAGKKALERSRNTTLVELRDRAEEKKDIGNIRVVEQFVLTAHI